MPTTRSTPAGAERGQPGSKPGSRAVRCARSRAGAGFTLLELLLVMSILAALLGMGAGVFTNLSTADRVALGQVKEAFRSARLYAQRESTPASLLILPAESRVVGVGLRTIGNWHFEDEAGTGWPVPARYEAESLVPAGVLGAGLQLGAEQTLDLPGLPPAAEADTGFGLDLFVRPEADPRPMTLFERAGVWSLRLNEEDEVLVTLRLLNDPAPEEFRLVVPGRRLPADRFTRITLSFDGRTLHLALNGQRAVPDTVFDRPRRLVSAAKAVLGTGTGLLALRGGLDELRLLAPLTSAGQELPADVRLEGPARLVHLDAFGRLDPAHHSEPVRVSFLTGDPPQRNVVECSMLGALHSWRESP
ncbi:MAG: prepilin-type N-terminal cleavage/methylation domain-containing protein [Planctomycetota bacterium]